MTQRKLFYAFNANGEKYYIDKLNSLNKSQIFLCPFCKREVIPRMGDNVIWHFSHRDTECAKLTGDSDPEFRNIFSFSETTEPIKFTMDSLSYQCPICKIVKPKELGVKFREGVHLCKECYRAADKDTLMRL